MFLEFTHQLSLQKLFRLYEDFYPKKEAVQKFLEHLNIAHCFAPCDPLTYTEAKVLTYMYEDPRCKAVANKLGCSVTTASNHISNINGKLTSGTLHNVLVKLRIMPVNTQGSTYGYGHVL